MSICPKNKSSKSRRDKRRANWKMSAPTLVKCSKCGALMMLIGAAALVVKRGDVAQAAVQLARLSPDLMPMFAILILCFLCGNFLIFPYGKLV